MVAGVDCFLPAIYGWISMSLLEALEIHFFVRFYNLAGTCLSLCRFFLSL